MVVMGKVKEDKIDDNTPGLTDKLDKMEEKWNKKMEKMWEEQQLKLQLKKSKLENKLSHWLVDAEAWGGPCTEESQVDKLMRNKTMNETTRKAYLKIEIQIAKCQLQKEASLNPKLFALNNQTAQSYANSLKTIIKMKRTTQATVCAAMT